MYNLLLRHILLLRARAGSSQQRQIGSLRPETTIYHGWGCSLTLCEQKFSSTESDVQGGGLLSLDPGRHFPRLEFSWLLSLDPFWVSCNAAR